MIAPCQLLCAAEVFAPLGTSPWDVSVQPHGLGASSRPSRRQTSIGAQVDDAHSAVIGQAHNAASSGFSLF